MLGRGEWARTQGWAQAGGRLQGESPGAVLASRTGGLGLGTLNPLQKDSESCSSAPPTSLLSPSQVTVSPAPATMVGHAWRRRRGSAACVCLAMGGTCAMLVSVLRAGGRVG